MKTKTNVKTGGFALNHNEGLNSPSNEAGLKAGSNVNPGGMMQLRKIGWSKPASLALTLGILVAAPQALRGAEIADITIPGLGCVPRIAINDLNLAATNGLTGSGGAMSGRINFGDITIVKGLTNCTVPLYLSLVNGTRFATAHLRVFRQDPSALIPVLDIELGGVFVTGVGLIDTGKAAGQSVSLSYSTITITDLLTNMTFRFDRNPALR